MSYKMTNFGGMLHLPNILDMLQLAHENGVKFPRVTLQMSHGLPLVLSRAGRNSRHTGAINLTDGKPYGKNRWYGRIAVDGYLFIAPNWETGSPELVDCIRMHLLALDEDPQLTAKLLGDETGKCCFCCKPLGNPVSVANGYGQICAHNFGLPFEMPKVPELHNKQLELELTSVPTDLEKRL